MIVCDRTRAFVLCEISPIGKKALLLEVTCDCHMQIGAASLLGKSVSAVGMTHAAGPLIPTERMLVCVCVCVGVCVWGEGVGGLGGGGQNPKPKQHRYRTEKRRKNIREKNYKH